MESNNNKERKELLEEKIGLEKKELKAIEENEKAEKEELAGLEKELEELEKEEQKIEHIIINGKRHNWDKKKIDLQQVIILAYGTYHADWTNTVAYEDGPKENPEGSMKLGQEIWVKNKMIFHATATFNS
jgi:hypothetical protein